jgi:lipopolysaccharide/colanic/teichoic acid biosynthesis glycosyltransferase
MRISGIEAARATRRQPLNNGAVELLLYLVLGILLPPALWFARAPQLLLQPTATNTMIAISLAAVSSWLVLFRLRRYANSRRLSYVLPVNVFTFGMAAAVVGALRLPYSVIMFMLAFASTTMLSFLVTALLRLSLPVQLVVPGGKVAELEQLTPNALYLTPDLFSEFSRLGRSPPSVVADLHYDHPPEIERMIAEVALAGAPVYHYKSWLEARTGQVRVDHLSETNRGSLIPNLSYMIVKRAVDIAAAVALMPILLPLFAIIALAIKLESSGSAFFCQERVGFRGKRFRIFKFRTMRERVVGKTAEALRQDEMTRDDDDRITRVGRVLRRYRLDELPQVFNVLAGDMSWIGPRPEAVNLSQWYAARIAFYSYRHIVRPGLTGWAQVNQGHVTDLDDINDKLRYDFYYIKNFSHWLDMLILLKSVRVILFGNGAR